MAEPSNEQELIARAQAGELDAFNDLVLRYQNYIYSITYRIMGEPDGAADNAQETFLTAYEKLHTYRGGSFKSWLGRIATNLCYDALRKIDRQRSDYIEELPGSEYYDEPPLPDNDPTPEQVAQTSELNRAIENCIRMLSDDQRIVLVMCDIQEMSYQDAADSIDVALGTVKSRLSRARIAMQRCLQGVKELLPGEYRQSNED